MQENIIVKGARANNLKNIDVTIPRDKLGDDRCVRQRQILAGV